MIDGFNIFDEIKKKCIEVCPDVPVYAIGSRARGTSKKNKWDFDIAIDSDKIEDVKNIRKSLSSHFEGRIDEFGNKIRVDVLRIKSNSIDKFKNSMSYAILL